MNTKYNQTFLKKKQPKSKLAIPKRNSLLKICTDKLPKKRIRIKKRNKENQKLPPKRK